MPSKIDIPPLDGPILWISQALDGLAVFTLKIRHFNWMFRFGSRKNILGIEIEN